MILYRGGMYRRSSEDFDLSLELLCADDFGAHYKSREEWTEDDKVHAENYHETRELQREVADLLASNGIHVDVLDTDDRSSRHSDAYVRFTLSQLPIVVEALDQVGITGDVLDVPEDFPEDLAKEIESTHYWTIEGL